MRELTETTREELELTQQIREYIDLIWPDQEDGTAQAISQYGRPYVTLHLRMHSADDTLNNIANLWKEMARPDTAIVWRVRPEIISCEFEGFQMGRFRVYRFYCRFHLRPKGDERKPPDE